MKRGILVPVAVFLISLLLLSMSKGFASGVVAYNFELGERVAKGDLYDSAEPVIYHPNGIDKNWDKIQDSLENLIPQVVSKNESALIPVVVTLYNPVSDRDLNYFVMLGGEVTQVYRYVTHGFAGVIPAASIATFVRAETANLAIIERDQPIQYHLDVSVPLMLVRPVVWQTYGFSGSSNHSIAILDTGIDDSHPDVGPYGNLNFSRKLVGWYDATADNVPMPQDYGEHGTHVAGIAAGTGAANGLQGSGNVQTTFTYRLPDVLWGYADYFDVLNPGTISLSVSWGGSNTVGLRLDNPAGTTVKSTSGKQKPLTLTYNTVGTSYPTGRYRVVVFNLGGPSGTPFSCTETYPYQGLNDGYNLFSGVAPNSRLVGVKVFDNTGSGTISTLIAGMDWIIQNRKTYRIVVASMSLGLENGAKDTTLDQKADTLVLNGIVTTVSAGNDYPNYTIGSPGTAAYVLTVAATNDQNGITSYSSNGETAKNEFGLIKPDVAAPGGTFDPQCGNLIISADSNDVDSGYSGYADRNPNDYQQMGGTSMSAPHVAGLAALVAQSFGSWNWTAAEALKVKMLLGMTSFETQRGEGSNLPSLNRGEKDSREGYGRVSADAAIEAATMTYSVGDLAIDMFGPNPSDKKVWVRRVSLSTKTKYSFQLSVPSEADYDLYLYNGSPDSYGQPIILKKSVNASLGFDEMVGYTPSVADNYYIVVKWVSGGGAFNLQSTSTLPDHDVGVVYVKPSPSELYVGGAVNITVTVKNYGAGTETFNVTAYWGVMIIGKQSVTGLVSGLAVNLTFFWDTAGVAPSVNNVVTIEASVILGEADTLDNVFTDGVVKVKLLGDVNGDGSVDGYDLALVSQAYRTRRGDPYYNVTCDLNYDGIIDLWDLTFLALNYGKKY